VDVLNWSRKVIAIINSNSSERMLEAEPEVNKHREEEHQFTRYPNLYIYNYEEYRGTILCIRNIFND
jgi:hypothetical protein